MFLFYLYLKFVFKAFVFKVSTPFLKFSVSSLGSSMLYLWYVVSSFLLGSSSPVWKSNVTVLPSSFLIKRLSLHSLCWGLTSILTAPISGSNWNLQTGCWQTIPSSPQLTDLFLPYISLHVLQWPQVQLVQNPMHPSALFVVFSILFLMPTCKKTRRYWSLFTYLQIITKPCWFSLLHVYTCVPFF